MSRASALHARPSAGYADKLRITLATLESAASGPVPVVQASSLGAEDVVIRHLIESHGLNIPAFVLDTGLLHRQTLDLLARTQMRTPVPVRVYRPHPDAVNDFVAREGADAMRRSIALRKACCGLRKVEPLQRALQGYGAWITGLRREQSDSRAGVERVEPGNPTAAADSVAARTKINPLADWTWGDVWHCIQVEGIDYNPLHDALYPSIGCEPCTRAISLGEDLRAGRWWWESEEAGLKECGLHLTEPSTPRHDALDRTPT